MSPSGAALRGLALGLLAIITVGVLGFGVETLGAIFSRRDALNRPSDATCTQSEDCDRKGLKASIRQADAAERTFDLGVWQIGLGLVGIYFVARTLKATRDAVGEANEATALARAAIDHERESSERSLRPYIFVEGVRNLPAYREKSPDVAFGWTLFFGWKNFGQTPARRVVATVNSQFFDTDVPPPDFDFPDNPEFNGAIGSAGPQQTWGSAVAIPVEDLVGALAAKRHLIIWGWCEYDGFPGTARHRSEFCRRAVILGTPTNVNASWRFDNLNVFNGVDETCHRQPQKNS